LIVSDVMDLLNKGGLLVWPILFCSIVGMTIFFERLLLYRKVLKQIGGNGSVYSLMSDGRFSESAEWLKESNSDYSLDRRIMLEALNSESAERETIEMVLVHGLDKEVTSLSKTLNTLGVLASVSPLLGLLGTVIGMIKAFIVVEEMGGSVNAAVLAGGIWEAMLTTAFGLLAAIPLLFFHNHLDDKLQNIQAQLEDVATNFMKSWAQGQKRLA